MQAEAIEGDAFQGTLVDPAKARPNMEPPTTGGDLFRVSDRPDEQVTLLYYGYPHCPDLRTTTMADLAVARDMLAARGA